MILCRLTCKRFYSVVALFCIALCCVELCVLLEFNSIQFSSIQFYFSHVQRETIQNIKNNKHLYYKGGLKRIRINLYRLALHCIVVCYFTLSMYLFTSSLVICLFIYLFIHSSFTYLFTFLLLDHLFFSIRFC